MNTNDEGKRRGRMKMEGGRRKKGKRKEEKMRRVEMKEGKKRKERKRMTCDFQMTSFITFTET